MNKVFVCLRFGKWERKATPIFIYERVYKSGYKPTLICLKRFRTGEDFVVRVPRDLEEVTK